MQKGVPEETLTILVVDDEQVVCGTLGRLLERVGYGAVCATHPETALRLFQDHDIDIVLSDIRMPGMDGIELLHRLRQLAPEIEVILISGHDCSGLDLQQEGAFEFLEKPVGVKRLLACLQRTRSYQRAAERSGS
jgi:DNA-binding NtrC family response regulator